MPDDSANPTTQDNNTTNPPMDDFVASTAAPVSGASDTNDIPGPADTNVNVNVTADTATPDSTSDPVGIVNGPASADTPVDAPTDTPVDAPINTPTNTPTDIPAGDTPNDLPPADPAADQQMYSNIANKISEAHNILIALSSNPSVDEMAAAIGLSLFLDKLGKRATAIYSGSTPNALEFLKPEETFESTADVLQDFVIALNKDKADHLRYKLDGDYVKIYITPYQTKITSDDLEFSYGDFNVDLVLSLDIANGIDLDSALREHGRIMHDAVIINLTTGNPGKFGEIEWSDKRASSVSEMVAKLLYNIKTDVGIGEEEATAFLTGIVAATNRFSNANTTPETMEMSSKLMSSGANQQLISKNITPDVDNEMVSILNTSNNSETKTDEPAEVTDGNEKSENDSPNLAIEHDKTKGTDENKDSNGVTPEEAPSLLDDLKEAEASLAQTGSETTPDTSNQPVRLGGNLASETDSLVTPETPANDSEPVLSAPAELQPATDSEAKTEPESGTDLSHPYLSEDKPAETSETDSSTSTELSEPTSIDGTSEPAGDKAEKVITPSSDFSSSTPDAEADKYGRMLEEALSDLTNPGSATALSTDSPNADSSAAPNTLNIVSNPATASTPEVSSEPEINGVPEMNFMPPAGENILPPPPAPPIDMSADSLGASLPTPAVDTTAAPVAPTTPAEPATPAIPTVAPAASQAPAAAQPAVQAPTAQSTDAGAFKIPGM